MTVEALRSANAVPHPAEPVKEEKLEQLTRLLESRALHGAENLRSFLDYISHRAIEHEEGQLKEYTIATDVFGRAKDFDSRTDSVVRVQAKRLREKLKEYYDKEGTSDTVLIDLPKGHYNVVFSYITPKMPAPAGEDSEVGTVEEHSTYARRTEAQPLQTGREKTARAAPIVLSCLLLIVVVALAFSNHNLQKQNREAASRGADANYGSVWEPLLRSPTPVMLVLSNPPVYRFSNAADPDALLQNSVELTPQQGKWLSDTLKDRLVVKQKRFPRLVLSFRDYTGMGEAIGLFGIADLFRSAGRSLTLKQSRTVSAEDMKSYNVIILGSVWSNVWSEKLPVREDFVHSPNATIENNNPLPGEEKEYKPRFNEQTNELIEDYAVVTVKPGVTSENVLITLGGIKSEGTQAAAEYVTRKEYLNALDQRLQELSGGNGRPKYFQALLKVDVDNGIPTTLSIVAVHELQPARN
jgi:hypothetical protein